MSAVAVKSGASLVTSTDIGRLLRWGADSITRRRPGLPVRPRQIGPGFVGANDTGRGGRSHPRPVARPGSRPGGGRLQESVFLAAAAALAASHSALAFSQDS